MCSADGKGLHYSIDSAGVWVDCVREDRAVIHNDYQSIPHRRGMPEGHAPVTRELLIPVKRGGRIVAILGTGNKPTDYDERDLEAVSLLANLAWDIVLQKRTEAELRSRERDLAKAQEVAHVNEQKNELLGMAAHDLRNPLAAIQGLVDLLVQQTFGDLEGDQMAALARIGTSSRRMVAMPIDEPDRSSGPRAPGGRSGMGQRNSTRT